MTHPDADRSAAVRALEVVDPHHHLWDLRMGYAWLQEKAGELAVHGDDSALRRDYLLADYQHDLAPLRLTASVHVDAGAADPVVEARWLQGIADRHGFPHGIVAGVDLTAPDVDTTLEALATLPNVRGVRHILNWHPDPGLSYTERNDLITDTRWLAGFGRLAAHGLSFDLQVYPSQLLQAARLAADHPETLVVLNHAGMPIDRDRHSMTLWSQGLRQLAAEPNTAVKISGLGMTDHRWTVDSLRPVVLETIGAFGATRSMFASNFPVDRLYSTAADLYDAFDAITAELPHDERRALFAGTAREVYRLGQFTDVNEPPPT